VNTFDRYSWTPIFWACFRDFDQTYDVLRSAGAKLEFKDGQSKTVLHWAAEKGSVKVLRKMLEADRFMDLEIKDTGGRTAMSWAAEKGQVGALKLLIAHDANKNAQSNDGWTPLFWAAKNGHVEAIRYLLGRRVNTSIIDAKGRRVLEVAHPVARSLFL
jgi:ankyrin repeat protein